MERQLNEIERAIQTLSQNSNRLKLADYWQVFWRGIPAKKSWGILSFVFMLFAVVATASWNASRYLLNTPTELEEIWLHGKVESNEGKPLDRFKIAVVEKAHGPFSIEDGSFKILVPRKKKYSILVWPAEGFYPSQYWGDVPVTKSGDTFELSTTLSGFPINLGILEGKVLYPDSAPVKGYIEVDGAPKKINPDGSFRITNIPLGKIKIRVTETINGPLLKEEVTQVQVTEATPKDVTISKEGREDR